MVYTDIKEPKLYIEDYFRKDWLCASPTMRFIKYSKALFLYYFIDYEYVLISRRNGSRIVDVKTLDREDYNLSWRKIQKLSSLSIKTRCKVKINLTRTFVFSYSDLRVQAVLRAKVPDISKDVFIFHCPTQPLEYLLSYHCCMENKLTIGWQHAEYERLNPFFNLVVEEVITHGYLYYSEGVRKMLESHNIKTLEYFKVGHSNFEIGYDNKCRGLILGGHPVKWKENTLMYVLSKYFGLGFRFHPKSIWSPFNRQTVYSNAVYSLSTNFVKTHLDNGFPGVKFSSFGEACGFFKNQNWKESYRMPLTSMASESNDEKQIMKWIESL